MSFLRRHIWEDMLTILHVVMKFIAGETLVDTVNKFAQCGCLLQVEN